MRWPSRKSPFTEGDSLEPRRRRRDIDPDFARLLAAQVQLGLADGDRDPEAALGTIALFLRNACDDSIVQQMLTSPIRVRRFPDGSMSASAELPREAT